MAQILEIQDSKLNAVRTFKFYSRWEQNNHCLTEAAPLFENSGMVLKCVFRLDLAPRLSVFPYWTWLGFRFLSHILCTLGSRLAQVTFPFLCRIFTLIFVSFFTSSSFRWFSETCSPCSVVLPLIISSYVRLQQKSNLVYLSELVTQSEDSTVCHPVRVFACLEPREVQKSNLILSLVHLFAHKIQDFV